MRVGIFTDTYSPDINGVVTSIVTLKKALETLGHTVFVITNHPSILQTSYEDRILRLPGVEIKFLYGYTMSSPVHVQAQKIVKDMDLDIIHVHSEFGVGMFGRAIAKQQHTPLVSTYHTTYEDYTHYVNWLGLKVVDLASKKAVAHLSKIFTKGSEVVISPSEKTKMMLLGYDIKKEIQVIPTGLDLSRFQTVDTEAIESIRIKHECVGVKTFVYIGRLAKEKSVDVVIDCFAALLNERTDFKVLIVGDGPSIDDLKAQAHALGLESHVDFVGAVPSEQVVAYYQAADAFISASLTETQGLTYIEALAAGVPVFARPDEPLESIIIDHQTGFLFTDTASFVTQALLFMNLTSSEYEQYVASAFAMADQFALTTYGQKMVAAYKNAIDHYHGKYQVQSIKHQDGEVHIEFESKDASETVVVDEFIYERRELEVGDELSRNQIIEIEEDEKLHEAYVMALSRLGSKDYSSFEMRDYLQERTQLNQDELDVVIDLLVRRHFIDDERYFRDRLDYLRSQHRGNNWIIEDLIKRGFERDKIINAFEVENDDDYTDRAQTRAERFLLTQKTGSSKEREQKLRQHLMRNGFGSQVIQEVISNTLCDTYDDEDEFESLLAVLRKSYATNLKRYSEAEARTRTVKHALNKGYTYDMLVRGMEAIEHED